MYVFMRVIYFLEQLKIAKINCCMLAYNQDWHLSRFAIHENVLKDNTDKNKQPLCGMANSIAPDMTPQNTASGLNYFVWKILIEKKTK